jgi:uncharacterized membrane protein YkvA (DUF1232 family)
VYAAFVVALVLAGRRGDARALATFIPDCIVLVTRLSRDPRVPRRRKLLLLALVGYLALPVDLVPDFIPVAGQLDDAIIVALVLRSLVRAGGEEVIRELWPGPDESLALILRLANRFIGTGGRHAWVRLPEPGPAPTESFAGEVCLGVGGGAADRDDRRGAVRDRRVLGPARRDVRDQPRGEDLHLRPAEIRHVLRSCGNRTSSVAGGGAEP